MNWGRIIGGGLLAGLVMNIGEFVLHAQVLAQDTVDLYTRFNMKPVEDPMAILQLVLVTFGMGIAMVWTYAAARPRLGPGPGTAICVALAVWFMAYVNTSVYLHSGFHGIFTARLAWLPAAWGFVELPLASLAGAWLYKE